MAESADAADSKSVVRENVWVQVPLPAPCPTLRVENEGFYTAGVNRIGDRKREQSYVTAVAV